MMIDEMPSIRVASAPDTRPVCPDEETGLGVGYAGGGTALQETLPDGRVVTLVMAPAAVLDAHREQAAARGWEILDA
jgi:hypothetical protein